MDIFWTLPAFDKTFDNKFKTGNNGGKGKKLKKGILKEKGNKNRR